MPTQSGSQIDYDNSAVMLMEVLDPSDPGFISSKLSVRVPSDSDHGSYLIFGNANFRIDNDIRSAKAEANTVDWSSTLGTYKALRYALKNDIDLDLYNNAIPSLKRQYKNVSAKVVTDNLNLGMEKRAADLFANYLNYPAANVINLATTPTNQWNDPSSNPIQDIINAKLALNVDPDVFACDELTWFALVTNPAVKAYIPGFVVANGGNVVVPAVTTEMFKAILRSVGINIREVLVGNKKYISSALGAAVEVRSYIWPKFALLAKVDPNAATILEPTFAKTFIPNDLTGLQIENYSIPTKKVVTVEGNLKYIHSLLNGNWAYFFRNPIA